MAFKSPVNQLKLVMKLVSIPQIAH